MLRVFYTKTLQHVLCNQQGVSLLSSNTWHGFLLVLWFDITHAHKKQRHHTGANRLKRPYKHILTSPVLCSQQLSVLHWMNNLMIWKIYFTHSAKSVQIRSYFWSVFSWIQTEHGDLLRKSPYSVRIQGNTDQK